MITAGCAGAAFARLLRAAGLLIAVLAVAAVGEVRRSDVTFPPGATGTVLRDRIARDEVVSYLFDAGAGQVLDLALDATNAAVRIALHPPGDGAETRDRTGFSGALPVTGTYAVEVYLDAAAAEAGESAFFSLALSLRGDPARGADGPAERQVVATGGSGPLRVHASPTAAAAIVARLPDGATVIRGACQVAEARLWCRVEAEADRTAGWVDADGLAAPPDTPPRPPTVIEHQVTFWAGSVIATYIGETRPRVATDYRLDLAPDDLLTVKLLAEDPATTFEIIAPGGASVHRAGSGDAWRGHLARDGTWTIRVAPSIGAVRRYRIGFMVE